MRTPSLLLRSFSANASPYKVPIWQWLCAASIFLVGLFLNSALYLPLYSEINPLDEIVYLSSGKNLLDGIWWPYSRGPMIAFVYAAIYPLANLFDNWLLASAVIGRFVSYVSFFVLAWLIGRELQFRRLSHPLIMVGAITVIPPYLTVITNPSYALFIIFAGLSFWGVMAYARTQSKRILVLATLFAGCAMLVRPDVVTGALFILAVVINTHPLRFHPSPLRNVLVATAAIAFLAGAYVVVFAPVKFGGNMKMYNTFEAAQQILADTKGMFDFDAAAKGKEESEKYFGTAEENNHSVFRAMARNPGRFAELIWVNTVKRTLPMFSIAYGGRVELRQPLYLLSWLVGLFALRGVIELIRLKNWRLLLTSLIWMGQLAVYLITISFPVYLQLPFYAVFMWVAIGLSALVSNLGRNSERAFALAILVCMYFSITPVPNMVIAAMVVATILFGLAALLPQWRYRKYGLILGLMGLGLVLLNWPDKIRSEWPGPKNGYEEQAAFLKAHFPERTPTLSFPASAAALAKMDWRGIGLEIRDIHSTKELKNVIERQNISVVLVDPLLTTQNIYGWATSIDKYGKTYFKQIWQSEDKKFKVLVPQKP